MRHLRERLQVAFAGHLVDPQVADRVQGGAAVASTRTLRFCPGRGPAPISQFTSNRGTVTDGLRGSVPNGTASNTSAFPAFSSGHGFGFTFAMSS